MPLGVAAPFPDAIVRRPAVVEAPHPPTGSPGGAGGSGPPAPIPICPPGTAWDPYVQACVAVGQGPTLTGNFPTITTTGGIGPTRVTSSNTLTADNTAITTLVVNANQTVAVADNSAASAVASVGAAVSQAIGQSVATAQKTADSTANYIASLINNYATTLDSGVTGAFGNIATALDGINSSISTTLQGVGVDISNELFNAVNPVTSALGNIVSIISGQIGGLAGAIGQAVGAVIPAIVQAVENPIGAITGVLGRIETDIGRNVAALTQVGSDISGGFTSLDATLGRLLTSWEGFTQATTGYPDGGSLHHDLSTVASAIAGLVTTQQWQAAPKLADFLKPPCVTDALEQLRQKPWLPPDEPLWLLEAPAYILMKLFASVVSWAFSVYPAALKAAEGGKLLMNEQCPQGLLNPEQLVDGVLRGYLTRENAAQEAARGNLDDSHFQTLLDLGTQQLLVAQLVEAYYRGIISQSDFFDALKQQGFNGSQQEILKALGVRLLSVAELQELYRRLEIDAPTLDTALKTLQFDTAQRKALADLAFRPARMQEAIDGDLARRSLIQVGAVEEADDARIPEFVSIAASAEGLNVDAMNQRWFDHWSLGSVQSWITLFFRGLVSVDTVKAVMARNYIPDSIQTTLIESNRPLVQYRTIANMLRIGQIDTQTAGRLLLQHGYSPESVQLLITYAQRPGAAVNAKQPKALHAVSLSIAHQEYIDGSISENDYYQILLAHGYTIDGANAEIAVVNTQQAMLQRKSNAQLVIDEYGSGLINEQTALAQLAVQGLTINELAKYTHRIKAFKVKNAKLPSEADLNHFLHLGIIDSSTYKDQLEKSGYSSQVADWFYQYRAAPPGNTASTLNPTSSTP